MIFVATKKCTTFFFFTSLWLLFLHPVSGMGKNQDPGSGINIPDPQRCEKQNVNILVHVKIWKYEKYTPCFFLQVDIRHKMGEIIRGKRRRAAGASSVYEKADDDIYIKRQRLNSEGDSNDSSDSDARFVFPSSFRATICAKQQPAALAVAVKPAERSDVKCADSGKTSPRLRQKIAPSLAAAAAPEASVSAVTSGSKERQHSEPTTEEPAEDNREMNRRSPNGFLLPDPLPWGERLRDTAGQVREGCRPE